MHWKEQLIDLKDEALMNDVLSNWIYPTGIARLIKEGTDVLKITEIDKGSLFVVKGAKIEESTAKIMRTLVPHMLNGAICSQASRLLHSIKKNLWDDDYDMRTLDVIEHVDILGVCQLDGLTKDETFELDRWVAVRGILPERYTLLFGDTAKNFRLTINAYEGKVLTP